MAEDANGDFEKAFYIVNRISIKIKIKYKQSIQLDCLQIKSFIILAVLRRSG